MSESPPVPPPSPRAIQDVYPPDYAFCYGCGRSNEHGLRLKSVWTGSEAVARYLPRPWELSVPGYVYGGLVASLIDCHAMASAAAHVARSRPSEDDDVANCQRCRSTRASMPSAAARSRNLRT